MYSVLIADDESIIRRGLTQLIEWEALGYHVDYEAANGKEALKIMLTYNPDLVLIDIRMPNIHGLESIKQAREAGFKGKVIILSGYSDFSYAKEAIKHGVYSYLTKPVDEDELTKTLKEIKEIIDSEKKESVTNSIYKTKARSTLLTEILTGVTKISPEILEDLSLNSSLYQIVFYEKYNPKQSDLTYNFAELLQVTNQNGNDFDFLTINGKNIILLKGHHATEKLANLMKKYSSELPPERNSPLDSIFIACGRIVRDFNEITISYDDAKELLDNRFFCDQYQHIVVYEETPLRNIELSQMTSAELLDTYTNTLVNHIQSYNRNMIAVTLRNLQNELYNAPLTIEEEKNLLVDLYLHIKEKIFFLYKASDIPFIANSEAVNFILQSYYLYEIITFLSKQFEMVMTSIGYSSRDSIIDDIVHYINHNYSENITLENIAPLFGYNSSYLGKIFSKKMGVNFNTYLDNIRIERSKELLIKDKTQVYKIAELVGYRNVDYFHIKFKKSTGISPAEFRRRNRGEE